MPSPFPPFLPATRFPPPLSSTPPVIRYRPDYKHDSFNLALTIRSFLLRYVSLFATIFPANL